MLKDVEGWLPNDLKFRGVADRAKLPIYRYREDCLLLHDAIHKYVTQFLEHIYDTKQKLLLDSEIQQLADCLTNEGRIKGVFGGGKFEELDHLIKTATSMIFIASVGHASANFGQYDTYGFPPAAPLYLNNSPPTNKENITEQDIMSYLPNKEKTLSIMAITKILSKRGTNKLGDFDVPYLYDPKSLEAVESFQKELLEVGKKIKRSNESRHDPYTYANPANIPNSISI